MSFDNLFIDIYSGDNHVNWPAYVGAGTPWCGAYFKVSEGTEYSYDAWMVASMTACRQAALTRLGRDFFTGGYHYWRLDSDPVKQANAFIDHLEKVVKPGDLGCMAPVIDVETAENGHPSAHQVIDSVNKTVEAIKARGYSRVTLYGGSFMYDLGIVDKMGCDNLWLPRYTASLPHVVYHRIGWGVPIAWQFRGDGFMSQLVDSNGNLYPDAAPGVGRCDISVVTAQGGLITSMV